MVIVIVLFVIVAVYSFAMGYFIRSQEKQPGWEGF